jgi:capsular exopolysaccharide synthesis family protein
MELQDYLRILRAHWVGVLVLTVLGIAAAGAYSLGQPKVYEANATGFVTTKSPNPAEASIADTYAKSRVTSYVAIATSSRTADAVIKQLNLSTTPAALIGDISVSQPTDTVLVDISARAGTPVSAQTLANAWVDALATQVAEIEGDKATQGQQPLRMLSYGSAALPSSPVLPRTKLNLAAGLVLGLLLGFAYAVVRKQLDRRLRSAEEVEKTFGVSVIGQIPVSSRMRQDKSQVLQLAVTEAGDTKNFGTAEAFRKLRTNLAYMDVDHPPRIIVVTSPKQSDGKSTIAANLAAAIAIGGQPVTLIDCDLRRPTVAESLGMVDGTGLTDVLVGRVKVADVLQAHPDVPGLSVLASGAIPPNPSELLGSQAMRTLVTDLAGETIVIMDAPPLLPVTDAAVLTRSADGALIVISHGDTLDSELAASLAHVSAVHGRTLGVIFNRMRKSAAGGAAYGDYYRYDYTPAGGKTGKSLGKVIGKSGKRRSEVPANEG